MNRQSSFRRLSLAFVAVSAVCVPAVVSANPEIALAADITTDTIVGPTGSGEFGNATPADSYNQNVIVLANGNIVIADPGFDVGSTSNVGAVYVYDGNTRERLSTLVGQSQNDRVGITIYTLNGSSNFVVASPTWDRARDGIVINSAGAITWINGATGLPHGETENQTKTYTVSITNSLVGHSNQDLLGSGGVVALTNGNYAVSSPSVNLGIATDNGAVTWGDGALGTAGAISLENSLTGRSNFDNVGFTSSVSSTLFIPIKIVNSPVIGIKALPNGNYVVTSPSWNDGYSLGASNFVNSGRSDVGAVTWVDGSNGHPAGESSRGVYISTTNSLLGTRASDFIGNVGLTPATESNAPSTVNGVVVLTNGNFVVRSALWDSASRSNVGAVTWVNGSNGQPAGESQPGAIVSAANSLIGSLADDRVGETGVTTLSNGNYVVRSSDWDLSESITNAGAVTHGNGTAGTVGEVSASNSLVGASSSDLLGNMGVAELSNGNYVVLSKSWDLSESITNAGAVTWVNGATGLTGVVSTANSLHGTSISDEVGSGGITALTNGNYVVRSPLWDRTTPTTVTNIGAVTWVNGSNGQPAGETQAGLAVSTNNSLIGSTASDEVSSGGVTALTNGNYVVRSPKWNITTPSNVNDVGAVTWMNGSNGRPAGETQAGVAVSTNNSLIGSTASDAVGSYGVTALTNGNYVVRSPMWDRTTPSTVANVGAVTWVNGNTGHAAGETSPGVSVTTDNSLHGNLTNDQIGDTELAAISNGNYVVFSRIWDLSASITNVGAVTWGDGTTGITGPVTTANSLHGSTTNDEVGNATSSAAFSVIPSGSQQDNLMLRSPLWDNTDTSPSTANTGAVTLFNTSTMGPRTTGPITSSNSGRGTVLNQYLGISAPVRFDAVHNRIYVHSYSVSNINIVTVMSFTTPTPPPPPSPNPEPDSPTQGSDNSASNTNTTTDSVAVSAGKNTSTNSGTATSSPSAILKRSSLPQTGSQRSSNLVAIAMVLLFTGVVLLRAKTFHGRRNNELLQ